ncbi:MAG: hypothetical protein KBG47_05495 [Bacteroidia bacterium]|nr:hypothetical protein [Bacteroidia bacterium]
MVFALGVNIIQAKPRTSRYELWWAFTHPFAALKVKKIYKRVSKLYDENSLKVKLDVYPSGGKLDAFRHVFHFAAFAQKIKPKKVLKLGKAHEKTNYLDFKNGKQEDGFTADSLSCEMDLLNNEVGVRLGRENKKLSLEELKQKVLELVTVKDGIYYILRDKEGRFIDCNNNVIDMSIYKGKWYIPKCIAGYKAQLEIE